MLSRSQYRSHSVTKINDKLLKSLARAVGFEPTTNRLTADCSTAELRPNSARARRGRLSSGPWRQGQPRSRRTEAGGPGRSRGRPGVERSLPPWPTPLVGAIENAIGSAVAGVAEPVDAQVSKTCSCKGVSVRSRPPAPRFRVASMRFGDAAPALAH